MNEKQNVILNVKNLRVKIGNEIIIDNLNFKVFEGEFISIIGPNGSGKTTLLKALLGIVNYEGSIEWKQGIKVNYLPQWFSKENFSVFPMNVKEFFELKDVSYENMIRSLKEVGLKREIIYKNPSNLSAGLFQRMLIAWTFCDVPDVVLLDEPTTGIDVGGEKTLYDLLLKYQKKYKTTILMVTHELNIVNFYSTRVLCLHHNCKAIGKPEDVLTEDVLEKTYGQKLKFHHHFEIKK